MEDKERRSEVHITNNFNAPIGQHIDHVETINFRMDGDGTFHFGRVEEVRTVAPDGAAERREEECFHYVHMELTEDEAWRVHDAVRRLVRNRKVADICDCLRQMNREKRVQLPPDPGGIYVELQRMGMPDGEGFSKKNFSKYYSR